MKLKTMLETLIVTLGLLLGKAATAADKPSVHGMLVFGESTIFFSHLPMFHSPHDYQAIFSVKISDEVKDLYLSDKKAHREERVYTFVPELMVLSDAVLQTKTFKGQLYRGHFERAGTLLANDVQVTVQDVIVFKKFDPGANKATQASYYLFGKDGEYWLAHNITKKPDFDHVIPVRLISSSHQGSVTLVNFEQSEKPLNDGMSFNAHSSGKTFHLETLRSIYLEFGDLAM
ncbi:hypothetical protein [Bdellovibrio svalbardensis]|uniref:Uncharacterized protein n=1 Tax=Bdellovibrio svalbardensis TaxID=2972972 RepID=A0ABT6DF39_9BACT|nr:hypothetical protein [Bdellovibrio svalbardensis]MDG0815124.1 hypothetical protein [Bdellovibrio svalbardensis]